MFPFPVDRQPLAYISERMFKWYKTV